MLINLSDVLSDQHKTVEETVRLEMEEIRLQSGTYPIISKEPVHVKVEHIRGKELLITAETRLSVMIPCDRCLEDVKREFELNCVKHVDVGLSDAELTEELDENQEVIQRLQGIWLDDNTEAPLFKIQGDSIYYASQINAPMAFSVHNDTMTVYSAQPIHYFIEECLSYSLRYRTSVGETVSLHKSESDTLSFGTVVPVKVVENGVFEKDSVIFHGGERYRGYAYINPTKKRVTLVSINEEGLPVENIYYDNIIHICVYKGKERLFSKDINKEMFARVVPADFLNNAILSDMDFVKVDEKGYRYVATLCIPDGAACYNVRLDVSKEGSIVFSR